MKFEALIDKERYGELLEHFLKICTDFIVVYPNDEIEEDYEKGNPLLSWKKEFMSLPNVTTSVYGGMENAIELHGHLSEEVKKIMRKALEKNLIWQYSLYKNEVKLFEVFDFNDGFIYE